MPLPRISAIALSLLSGALALVFTGCGTASLGPNKPSASSSLAFNTVSGTAHGGQQAIVGAAVTLWAAGTTGTGAAGYGANATLVGTTTTVAGGAFNFDVAGISICTPGQYLYITATGGDAGSGINNNIALMAAIPQPCSSATGGQFVVVNEVSTVAAVWSLQQFMKISPGTAIPWMIGAPSTNVTGLANAFTGVAQLVNLSTGLSAASITSNTVTSTIAGVTYTTTIAPDFKTINTLADILAYCINATTAGTSCPNLFTDVTPGTASAPTDTIQAAYYLATNAGGLTMPAYNDAAGAPHHLCTAYPSAQSPFQPILACSATGAATTVPTDWNIGVTWSAKNPAAVVIGTQYVGALALDGSGNLWTGEVNTSSSGAYISEFNPAGQMMITPISTVAINAYNVAYVAGTGTTATTTPLAYAGNSAFALKNTKPYGIQIDTNGNAWFSVSGATGTNSPGTLTNGSVSLATGVLAQVTPGGTATGYLTGSAPSAVAIDGNNNVYMIDQPATSNYIPSELTAASSYQTLNKGVANSTAGYNFVIVDDSANQYAWAFNAGTACTSANYPIVRETTATAATGSTAADIKDVTGCAYYGAFDAVGNFWATGTTATTGNLYYLDLSTTPLIPAVTTIAGSVNTSTTVAGGTGGLDNPRAITVDGVGNVWVANGVTTAAGSGLSVFVPTTAGGTTTVTALSPSAAGVYGFGTFGVQALSGLAIDSSGNVWMATNALALTVTHLVGAAAPVVTPTSVAVKNATLAMRP
jgi:hypothetical protein